VYFLFFVVAKSINNYPSLVLDTNSSCSMRVEFFYSSREIFLRNYIKHIFIVCLRYFSHNFAVFLQVKVEKPASKGHDFFASLIGEKFQ
jgi:hypothetical protein